MRVVEKFEAMFGQRPTGSIKDTGSFATCLFIERLLVRNPSAADVFQTQRLRFGRNALNVVATLLVRKVATHGSESSRSEERRVGKECSSGWSRSLQKA